MSRTLSQLKADVRELLDDTNSGTGARWSNSAIELSIYRAADHIGQMLAKSGPDYFRTTVQVSLTASQATVPANNGIINVFLTYGQDTYRIKRGNGVSRNIGGFPDSGTLTVDYIPKFVPPAGDGYALEYAGVELDDYIVDQFCAYMAASDCKTKEGENNPLIEKKLAQLEMSLLQRYSPTVISSSPIYTGNGWYKDTRWFESGPTTIKLYR
jgi:hypothetical protein